MLVFQRVRQLAQGLFRQFIIFPDDIAVVLHSILVQRVTGSIIAFDQHLALALAIRMAHAHAILYEYSHPHIQLTGVEQHAVLLEQCLGGLRFCQQHGIHLVILQHIQPDVHVIHLDAEHALCLQLGTVDSQVSQHIRHRVAGHRQHVVVEMRQTGDTLIAIADEQPIRVGRRQIVGSPLAGRFLPLLHPHEVSDGHLHPAPQESGVAVHLSRKALQADIDGCIKHLAVFGHVQRQTVERRQHGHLQCSRVFTQCLLALLLFQPLRLLIRLSAARVGKGEKEKERKGQDGHCSLVHLTYYMGHHSLFFVYTD